MSKTLDFIVLPLVIGGGAFLAVSGLEKFVEIFPFLPKSEDYTVEYGCVAAGLTLLYQVGTPVIDSRKPY